MIEKGAVIPAPVDMAPPAGAAPVAPEVAEQPSYVIETPRGKFTFGGLATDKDGSITITSLIDMFLVCMASVENPVVEQILRANDVIIKDQVGRLFFPRPNI